MKNSTVVFLSTKRNVAICFLAALFVTGCAKINDISTNLDAENFKNYFSPTKVKIVDSEKDLVGKRTMLRQMKLMLAPKLEAKPTSLAPMPLFLANVS